MIKTYPSRRQGTRYLVRGALLSVAMVGLGPTAGYAMTIRDPYCQVSQQAWQVYDVKKFCDLVNKDLAEGRMPDLLARLEESRRVPQPPPTVSRPTVSARPPQPKKPPDVTPAKNDRATPSRNVRTTRSERPATPPSRTEKSQSIGRHHGKPIDRVTEKPPRGKAIRARQDKPRTTPTVTPSPAVSEAMSPRPITPSAPIGHLVPSPRVSGVTSATGEPLIVPIGKALLYGMAVAGATALLLRLRIRPMPTRVQKSQNTEIGSAERQDEMRPSVHGFAVPLTMSTPEPAITVAQEPNQVDKNATLITIRVLDQVTVYGPAGSADCSRGKDVADLLGLLVVHRDGLTRERAYQVLWPDIALDHYDCFHGPKSELRDKLVRVLGSPNQGKNLLQYVGGRYRLNPALVTTDLWQFRDALAEARRADSPEQVIASLRRAIDLYAGPFLPAGTHPWATEAAEDLRHDVIQALLRLSELDPDVDRVTAVLERAHRLDPVNEQVSCQMMRHFSALGRNDAVYATYRDLCQALAELDGLSPSVKTRELYGRLTGHAS